MAVRPLIRRLAVGVTLVGGMSLVGVACTTEPADPAASGTAAPSRSVDPAILAPLEALGPCDAAPVAATDAPVDGLQLPHEAVVTSTTTTGVATRVEAWLPWTPVQLRVWYQQRDDLEIIEIEDEVFEAEALVSDGTHRMFVKAQAVCELGSLVIADVAPDSGIGPDPTIPPSSEAPRQP